MDSNKIKLGDDWEEKIYSDLASTVFFILIITPRYIHSHQCRREFHFFVNSAAKLGVEELILSLHYVDVPALQEESPDDDLIKLLKQYQWKDWRDLRFCGITSEKYRKGVFDIAERLANANKQVEKNVLIHLKLSILKMILKKLMIMNQVYSVAWQRCKKHYQS